MLSSFDQNIFIKREKYTRCDKQFLPLMDAKISKSSEDLVVQNTKFLLSNDPNLICQSLNFFEEYIDSLELQTLSQIFKLKYDNCFEILDCLDGLLQTISKRRRFLEDDEFAMMIINFLLQFSNLDEKQFIVTAYNSISCLIYANKNIALYLCSNGFFNQCFVRFQSYIHELSLLDNDDITDIDDYFYLIDSLLKVFSSLHKYPDLINSDFSCTVVKCFHLLLNIETPTNHTLKLKVLVFDNIYWFAISASDKSIQNLLTPRLLEIMLFLMNSHDAYICSVFESIGKITSHGDQFSLFFIQPPIDLLNRINNFSKWGNETKYSFIKILRNFAACKDNTPSLSIATTTQTTNFIKSVLNECSFNAQKEAFVILFFMIMTQVPMLIEYVLANFSNFFPNLIEFLNNNDIYFNSICLYSFYISLNFLEAKDKNLFSQFCVMFKVDEWSNLFDELTSDSDENLSKLSMALINKIEL